MRPQNVVSDNFIPAYVFYKTGISIALKKKHDYSALFESGNPLDQNNLSGFIKQRTLTQFRRLLFIQITGIVPVSSILRRTFKKHSFY
jgi:hypothetical protein